MAQFEDAFSCAICCEVYTDPVRWPCADDAQCSHSFCRLCAFSALQRDSSASSCPMCRAPTRDGATFEPASKLAPDADLNDVVADIFPAAKAAARAEAHALALSKYEEANISETMLHLVRLPCPRLQPLITAPLTPSPRRAQLGKWKVVQGQVIHLCLSTRSPAHLRMFSQALTTVERRVGLVLGDVAAPGVRGRFATLVGVGFEPLSPAAAETRVRVWALQSRATEVIKLRVRVGAPFTILHVASHPAAVHNVAPRNPPPGSYIQRDDGSGGWDFAVASVFGEAPAPAEPRTTSADDAADYTARPTQLSLGTVRLEADPPPPPAVRRPSHPSVRRPISDARVRRALGLPARLLKRLVNTSPPPARNGDNAAAAVPAAA